MEVKNEKPIGGLMNIGSTCYINTSIQCLANCKLFIECILENSKIEENTLIFELKSLLTDLYINKHSIKPYRFINALQENITEIIIHEQNDINEFISLFIEKINKNICYDNSSDSSDFTDINFFELTKKEYSSIIPIFYGLSLNKITCRNCNEEKINNELFLNLMLPLNNDSKTLYDCFDLYFKDEVLEEWSCNNCHSKNNNIKQNRLSKVPYILIVSLKKFTSLLEKNNNSIQIPLKLDISKYCVYKNTIYNNKIFLLKSIACHIGDLNSGHYYSIINKNDSWYIIDDLKITIINSIEMLNNMLNNAYVYFYECEI